VREASGRRPPSDPTGSSRSPVRAAASPERAMRTCPVCGSELAERKCKLDCPRSGCGYFLSCSDFY